MSRAEAHCLFRLAHIHGLACCLFILLLILSDPAVSKSRKGVIEHDPHILMNNDPNPFAGYEPNATGELEDLGGDFDLAGAAGTGSVLGGSDQGAAPTQFPHHGQGWERLSSDPRSQLRLKLTRQFHRCPKKKGKVQLSPKTLRQNS